VLPQGGDPVRISWRCLILIQLKWLGYRMMKKCDNMLSRFHLIPERHGRTDGRTDRIAISISRVSVLTRDKNVERKCCRLPASRMTSSRNVRSPYMFRRSSYIRRSFEARAGIGRLSTSSVLFFRLMAPPPVFASSLASLSSCSNKHQRWKVGLMNPLIGTLKPQSNGPLYCNTVIGTLAVNAWAVTFGSARYGLGGLRPRPIPHRCTKCYTPPINGQSTNFTLFDHHHHHHLYLFR